jgi:hypothetical protein
MNNIPNNMKTIEEAALESANKAFGLVEDMHLDMDKEMHNYHQEAFKAGVRYIAETLEQIKATDVKSIRMHDLIKELQKILNDVM